MKKVSVFMGLALIVAFALAALSHAQQKVNYKVSGDYFEGCACQLSCACDFGENATAGGMGCQASIVLHVVSGSYGDVKLDGLTAVGMILKPELNIAAAMGKIEGGLYIDEKANKAQRDALAAIITDQLGALFGKMSGPKYVPISFGKNMANAEGLADEYSVEIPNILTLKISAIKDEKGKRTGRINVPMMFVPVQYQAKASAHMYNDKEWATSWDLAGRNGFYGQFVFASKPAE